MKASRSDRLMCCVLLVLSFACSSEGFDKVWDPPQGTGGSTPGAGGASGTGGAASGGAGTGGAGAGGAPGAGGTSSGGNASGGASSAGGDSSAGGEGSGGLGTGGTDGSGGEGTGGEGTGGEGTGGAQGSAVCSDYCSAWFAKACNGAGGEMYAGQTECLSACAPMAEGTAGDASGDTVQCRVTHLGLAMQMDTAHCGHAQQNSTGNCVD